MNSNNDYKYCHECGSEMYSETVERSFTMKDKSVVTITRIKAYICSNPNCDEEVYDSETVRKLEEEILKRRNVNVNGGV